MCVAATTMTISAGAPLALSGDPRWSATSPGSTWRQQSSLNTSVGLAIAHLPWSSQAKTVTALALGRDHVRRATAAKAVLGILRDTARYTCRVTKQMIEHRDGATGVHHQSHGPADGGIGAIASPNRLLRQLILQVLDDRPLTMTRIADPPRLAEGPTRLNSGCSIAPRPRRPRRYRQASCHHGIGDHRSTSRAARSDHAQHLVPPAPNWARKAATRPPLAGDWRRRSSPAGSKTRWRRWSTASRPVTSLPFQSYACHLTRGHRRQLREPS
jgi:hypothetical protein